MPGLEYGNCRLVADYLAKVGVASSSLSPAPLRDLKRESEALRAQRRWRHQMKDPAATKTVRIPKDTASRRPSRPPMAIDMALPFAM